MLDNMRSDAYNEIKYRIIHFDYIPGQKISEKLISQELSSVEHRLEKPLSELNVKA